MAEENYKPYAKCQFYMNCSIYNSNILKENFEKEMCGTGLKPDKKYVPNIPQHSNITPVKHWELWPEGPCPAFEGYLHKQFRSDLTELLRDVDRVLQGKPPILKIE